MPAIGHALERPFARVPVARLNRDGSGLVLGMGLLAGDLTDATAIAVTVEPPGGSTQPTTDPVGVATLA